MKKTALYQTHLDFSAQIVDFGGWALPIRYDSVIQEHRAVREKVGIFDVSHMGNFLIQGQGAFSLVNHLISNDLSKIEPLKGIYSPLLYENGTFVDDVIVYMITPDQFLMIVNATNLEKDFAWIANKIQERKSDCRLEDISQSKSLIAIQGKESEKLIHQLFPNHDLSHPFSFSLSDPTSEPSKVPTLVANTGYTGEMGVEILMDQDRSVDFFKRAVSLGAAPCGLGARDSLRLEKGYSLYGHEITDQTNALEAGLGWTVSFDKEFIGKEALLQIKREGLKRRLIGLIMEGRRIPREESEIFDQDGSNCIGKITSGGFSISLEKSIGLGYIERGYSSSQFMVKVGNQLIPATKHKRVFV